MRTVEIIIKDDIIERNFIFKFAERLRRSGLRADFLIIAVPPS